MLKHNFCTFWCPIATSCIVAGQHNNLIYVLSGFSDIHSNNPQIGYAFCWSSCSLVFSFGILHFFVIIYTLVFQKCKNKPVNNCILAGIQIVFPLHLLVIFSSWLYISCLVFHLHKSLLPSNHGELCHTPSCNRKMLVRGFDDIVTPP